MRSFSKQCTVKFYGHILTDTGLHADPSKIDAIVKMPPPPDVKTLQSYLGLVNYMARFQLSLSSVSRPLRDLLKEKVDYVWSPEADKAFNDIKRAITCAPVLSYFDLKKDTVIQSDASMNGLGCALIQDDKPVCYASRALTEAESRYSNIERELLAAMWSLEHFNHYIEGSNVTLQTDNKPFVSIWSKSINTASPRIQRLLLRMSRYNVKLEYIAGRHNVIADALSRFSLRTSKTTTPYSNAISIDEILCSTTQMSTTGTQRICVMRPPKMSHFNILRKQLLMVGRKSTKTVLLIYTHSGTSEMNFLLRTNYSSRVTELLFPLHYNSRY